MDTLPAGFTLSNGPTRITTPAPSLRAWHIILAVLPGGVLAIVAGKGGSHHRHGCGCANK